MAIGAVMHTFSGSLADVDRGVYEEISFRTAQHASETGVFMLTRVLAYLLEHEEGIAFSEGISATDEPAVMVRDLTGRVTAWIEVGAPDVARLHYGSKLADRTRVYTQRDPGKLIAGWAGKPLHRAEEVLVHGFDAGFLEAASALLERRNTITVSVTEQQLYLELNGQTLTSAISSQPAG